MQTLSPPTELNNHMGSTLSLWMEEHLPSPAPLKEDLRCDVCIVGGGIVGLICAYLLLQQGKSVIVLESGPLVGGQTSRTTGHLAWALDDHFFELERLFGLEGARLAAESHQAAIHTLEKIIQEEKIACDFEKLNAYLFLAPEDEADLLEKEWTTLNKMEVPVEKLDRAPLSTFDTGPCIKYADQAQFHILKFLKGLVEAIYRKNGKIFANTHVNRMQDGSPCRLITTDHHLVLAQSAIIATNTPINDRFMIHTKQAPYRTYVIAGKIPKDSVKRGLYYDTGDPYHYIRLQSHATDPQSDWLIVGGEDHKTGQEVEVLEKYENLEKWTRQRFPMMQEIGYRWSGQIFEPMDCLAFIGRNPHDKNIYIATGDSGNGLTHGTIAGLLLSDLICGRDNPWAKLYDPARKNLLAAGEFAKENLNVAAQYGEWLLPGEVESVADIAPDTGALIREGLTKYAVYRDKQGQTRCYSAVCPHLGCFVKWNAGEKVWDCPCHGSCFDTHGKVLNGPAISDLTPAPDAIKETPAAKT